MFFRIIRRNRFVAKMVHLFPLPRVRARSQCRLLSLPSLSIGVGNECEIGSSSTTALHEINEGCLSSSIEFRLQDLVQPFHSQ